MHNEKTTTVKTTLRAKKATDTATPPAQTNNRNSNINNTHSHWFPRTISYTDITHNKTQSFTVHNEPTSETSEIKKLLLQTAKNTESISTMILEQSQLLKEQPNKSTY